MATTRGSLFDPTLVKDLVSKVTGKSSLAALCAQTPIPFNGMKEMIFSMDKEIDIVAEGGEKSKQVVQYEDSDHRPVQPSKERCCILEHERQKAE